MSKNFNSSLQVIDRWMRYQTTRQVWPGCQVSVRKGPMLIFNKAYGYANIKTKERYTTSHLGRLASQSKVFTAVLGLILEQQDFICLDSSISSYLPELRNHKDKRIQKVSLLDIMSNRAGLIRDSYSQNYWGAEVKFSNSNELLAEVMQHSLVTHPNKKVKYSNIGYGLLGLVFEKATGKTFKELVDNYLLKNDFNKIAVDYEGNLKSALGYVVDQTGKKRFLRRRHRSTQALTPAAGFCGTTADVTNFFYQLYKTNKILPVDLRKKMLRLKFQVPGVKSHKYGLGTIFNTNNGYEYIGHSGGFPGFSSQTWVIPKEDLTLGLCVNLSYGDTFEYVRGMQGILSSLAAVFTKSELLEAIVSYPLIDNISATIYVVGKTKAVSLPLAGSCPAENMTIFKKRNGKFFSNQMSGYRSNLEPLEFEIRGGQIISVSLGGYKSFPMKTL